MMANFPLPYRVTLGELLPEALSNPAIAAQWIQGLDSNSRTVEAGDLFLACPGARYDGRDYIDDAILRGAVAVCYEKEGSEAFARKQDCVAINQRPIPVIPVAQLANRISQISAHYFHQPAQRLRCYGVTGTNGKTTCTWWLAQLLSALGKKAGLVGTLGCGVFEPKASSPLLPLKQTGFTTPDAIRLQQVLFQFSEEQATHAVMEVSSHSLDQGRVNDVLFTAALFTNLTRDHLDYHGSVENYGAAKARLFAFPSLQHAVINIDDAFGASLSKQLKDTRKDLMVISYSVTNTAADVHVKKLCWDSSGVSGTWISPWGERTFQASVYGEYNVANLIGVMALLCAEGFAIEQVVDAVSDLSSPPGRLEKVSSDNDDVTVFVDFAHTPDALEKVLSTLKNMQQDQKSSGKLWCVFGCGGDRDQGKRPLMGEVVTRLADQSVVTSDNPRYEEPQAIIDQIVSSCDAQRSRVIVDRQTAIAHAIQMASAGDAVVLAGKGHEAYQEIKGEKHAFSDAAIARQALQQRQQAHKGRSA